MNEELLLAIYQNEGFESRGISFDKFKADIENPELQKAIFDNAGFAQRGKTIDQFRSDLGIGKSPAGLAKGSILDEEDLSVIETNAQKRAEDFSKKERAKQVFVPGAPNFGSVAVEKKLKQDTESATKQARREELDRVVKEAELSYQDFSPEQVYDIINPGDRASRMKNAEALRKDLERKADSEGRVNIKKIDDTFLFDIANPLPGLGNEIANLFGKKYTKSEVINAKPGELPEFPDTPAGKEKLRIAKEYMAAEEMEAARVKLGEMNEYTNFVDRHSKLSPLVEDALATMQEVARREREGTLTQAVYDASAEAEKFLRDLDPETKKTILDRERTLTAIGVQYGELDKKYPAVKIINQLNEDLQFAYDEKYAKKGQWGRAMVNLGAALGEAVPRLGYGLNSTFDMIGTLIGSDGAQANMIREANEMVQRGTFRDASIQQRPIHERVGDVVYKDKAYRIGFDEEGNVTNIYNSFGNVADIDQKTAQSILKEIERKPGIFATSKKELNGSATWNAITDGFSDLIGTFMLGAGMGKVVGGAGQIATRARDFVPIVFQYSGKLTAEGIRQGLTPEQAAVYGISHGVGEGFTEQIFPMVGKFTGSNMGLTQAFKRVGAKTGSDFVRKMGRKELLTGIVGIGLEGGEEGIAELLDPIINPALNNLYGSELNTALPTREEVATSIGIGAAISVIPGIVGGMGRSRLIKSDGFVTQSLYSLLNNMEATKDIATRIATPESVELLSKLEQLQGIVAPTLAKNIPPSEKMKVIADEWNALSINQAEEGHIPTPIEDDPNFVADYLKEQEELAASEEETPTEVPTTGGQEPVEEAPDNVIIPTYSSSSTVPSSFVSDATGVERITSSDNIPVDLLGKLVDYRGTKGTLVEEEGGFYVIDSEGERTFIESGGSGLTNEELGLKEFRTVSTDFNNNKVTIDGKEYEYVDSTETKDGFNVVLKNDKGKEVIVREPNTVARIRRDRKLHQNNYNNVSDDRLGRAIENVLLAGEPTGGTEGIESGEPTETVGGAGSVRGGGPVREVLAEERAEVSQVESDLNLLFGLVYDAVEANQLEFKDSTNKFFGEIFTINGIVGNQKELAKRFGSLFENTRFSKELKDLLGEDTIAEVKRLYRRKLSLQQKLTPTNVKKRVMEHNKAIADELRKERAAKEKAMRIRLGLEVDEEAPVKTKPTDSKRVESVELPVTTNSILEQGNDNLGDDKQPFMYTLPQVLDSVPAERREVTESLHKKEVKRALEDGLFATAVKQGRMQQSDVDAILASVQETTTEEPISLPPTPPPPVEAKPVSPRRRYTKVRGKVEPVEIKIEGEGVAMVIFEDKSTDFLPKSVLHKSEETATKAKTPKKDKPIIKGMALLGQEFPGQEIKDETIKNHRQLEPKFGLQVGDTITSKNGKTKYVVTGFTMDKVIVADNGNGYVQEVEYNPEKELVTDIRAAYDRVPSEESIPVDVTPVEETTTEEEPVQETPVIETPPIPENEVVEKTIVPIEGIVEVGDEVMYLGKEFKVTKVGTNTVSLSGLTVRSIMGGVAINELEGKIVKRNINKVLGSFKKAEGPNGAQVIRANTALQFLRDNGVNQVDIKFLEKLYDKYQSSKKKDDLDNYERMLKNVIGAENVRRQQLAKNHDPNDILLETTLDKALKDVKPTLGRGQQIVLGLLKNLNTRVIVLPRKYFLNNDGYFDPKGNVIMLRDDFNESTLIHEGIHSLTAYLYNHDETFKTEFDTMFNQLKKNLSEGRWKSVNEFVTDEYGFSDPEEFLTELFSDPYFANTVGTLPATVLHPDYTGIRLLDHIINMIVRAFNLGQFGSMNVSEYWANRMRKNEAEFHKAIQYFFNERAIGDPVLASLDKDSILYHGTRKSDATIEDIRNAKNRFNSEGRHYGIYTTEDFDVANWYTGSKTLGVTIPNKGRVLQFRISENAKQLDLSNPEELLRYANEQRMFDQYDVDESLRITAQIVDNEVVEAANGTFANDLMRIAQREGYKVVIIPDYTNKNHISHVVLDPNVLEPAETELYGSLSSFFKGLFGRKVMETPDILPEEREIIQPQIDTNKSYNKEIGLKAVVNLVNKGRIPNDAATIYRAGKAAFDIQGITENDIRNVLMPNVVTAPIPEPIIEEKPNEITTEVPIVEEKVKKTNNNVPGTDGEATPAQRTAAFKVNNAVMRDIRENVITSTGSLAGFVKQSKRTLERIVAESSRYISVDGTYNLQDQIVARVNSGYLLSAAEQVALGYSILNLQRVQDQQTAVYLKAKENGDQRETDLWADLVVTESKILGYTKALIEAGTELGRGLAIRSKILDTAMFTEQGFLQYTHKRLKRMKIDPDKMKSEDQKFIKRIAKQLYENRKKVKELKAQLKLKGDQLKRAIFDDQIEEVKKRKEAMNQARAAKNLTEAIAQLDKILIDPNC